MDERRPGDSKLHDWLGLPEATHGFLATCGAQKRTTLL